MTHRVSALFVAAASLVLVAGAPAAAQRPMPLPGPVIIDGPGPVFGTPPDTSMGPSLLRYLPLPRGTYELSGYVEAYTSGQVRQRNRFGGRFYPAGERWAIDVGLTSTAAVGQPFQDVVGGGLDLGARYDAGGAGTWVGGGAATYPTGPVDYSWDATAGAYHEVGPVSVNGGLRLVGFGLDNRRNFAIGGVIFHDLDPFETSLTYLDVEGGVSLPVGAAELSGTLGFRTGASFIGESVWARTGLAIPVRSGMAVELGAGTRGAPEHNLAQRAYVSLGFRYLYTRPQRLDR